MSDDEILQIAVAIGSPDSSCSTFVSPHTGDLFVEWSQEALLLFAWRLLAATKPEFRFTPDAATPLWPRLTAAEMQALRDKDAAMKAKQSQA